jgi:hypothetical protein
MITKGPWNVEKATDDFGWVNYAINSGKNYGEKEGNANAQAISAVPDMIEALQDVKELIGNGIAIINDNAPSGTQAEISTVYSKISQALAKAGIK